ncbi:hypothetical protein BCR39DRAFT_83783 [Naematelia encephala]|uniref:CipC-like antibiotic response protein n=1 Tax=Naematelia encephala TaxID=71784 RepID=A0A1Y2ADC5_9TREE|nr:hypothetical protein BCR39DRAFT_83783 [Naematelia encephala]
MVFDKFRTKIHSHFSSSPIATQRDEFLAVNSTTPLERKAHFTPEIVGGAAAYEAMKAFEHHEVHKGSKPTHARAKEIIAGIATGYAVKLIEEKNLPFSSEVSKKKFKAEAQLYAARDSKRALRESSFYGGSELDPIDNDEKYGNKVM